MRNILVGRTVYGDGEVKAVKMVLDGGWLGIGKWADKFEKKVAEYVGHKYGIVTNSGSSALLLAIQALDLPKRSKVIVCAAGFPATVAPILHAGLTPVFVDAEITSYCIDPDQLKYALEDYPDTKAVVFAHTIGNVANMDKIMPLIRKYKLKLVEDICDALAAKWDGKQVGSFGDIACLSFYPSHHITAGGLGGMVLTSNKKIATNVISLRDWGKMHDEPTYYDSYTTNERHFVDIDGIQYDYRYAYSHIGYNLKPADMNCAFGLKQMERLPSFVKKRNANFMELNKIFAKYDARKGKYFLLPLIHKKATPSWFNYPIWVHDESPFTRNELVKYFEEKGIHCRLFFAGNITRHPAFKNKGIIANTLVVADSLMKEAFLIACHPALTDDDIKYIGDSLRTFIESKKT